MNIFIITHIIHYPYYIYINILYISIISFQWLNPGTLQRLNPLKLVKPLSFIPNSFEHSFNSFGFSTVNSASNATFTHYLCHFYSQINNSRTWNWCGGRLISGRWGPIKKRSSADVPNGKSDFPISCCCFYLFPIITYIFLTESFVTVFMWGHLQRWIRKGAVMGNAQLNIQCLKDAVGRMNGPKVSPQTFMGIPFGAFLPLTSERRFWAIRMEFSRGSE